MPQRLPPIALSLILFAAAHAPAQTTAWEESMASAYEAYQASRFAEAEKFFLSALHAAEGFGPEDPRLATTLNNLGELHRTQGKYAKAEPYYKRSLNIADPHYLLGRAWTKMGQPDQARRHFALFEELRQP